MCDDNVRVKRKGAKIWRSIRNRVNTRNYELSSYKIIENLDRVDENMCIKVDIENQRIYKKLQEKAKKVKQSVGDNSYLSLSVNIDKPPRPSNQERFILWKKRNVKISVIPQTQAVIFLEKMGYSLDTDYEAYQAIELADEIKQKEGIVENEEDKTQNFDILYTDEDKNIFRNRSLYGKKIEPEPFFNNGDNLPIPSPSTPESPSPIRRNTLPKSEFNTRVLRRQSMPIHINNNRPYNSAPNTPNNSPSNGTPPINNLINQYNNGNLTRSHDNLYPSLDEFNNNTPPDYSIAMSNQEHTMETPLAPSAPIAPSAPKMEFELDNKPRVNINNWTGNNQNPRNNRYNRVIELYPGCDSDTD